MHECQAEFSQKKFVVDVFFFDFLIYRILYRLEVPKRSLPPPHRLKSYKSAGVCLTK